MADEVRIEELTAVDDAVVAAFERLIPQLSSSNPPPTRETLERIVASEASALLVAREVDGTIVGTTTLVTFPIPTATRAWIEDVVVDRAASGRGISYDLTRHALDLARQAGCGTVDLTSRPSREAANHVYRKLGFEQRDTNVYRYELGG
jgi:ribosomal protein S18 acetylase RimI-like enzyme